MRFYFELKIIGLCVVIQAGERECHRIVAVDPNVAVDPDVEPIPRHDVYLSFEDDFYHSVCDIEAKRHDTQWRVNLPPRTTVKFPPALERYAPFPHFDPTSLTALGLGQLTTGVGEGCWKPCEQGRALLPKANAHAGWTGDLGEWTFKALGDTDNVRRVACAFMWGGWFDNRLQIDLDLEGGREAHVILQPSDRWSWDIVRLAYSCIEWPEYGNQIERPKPFQNIHEIARVTTENWHDDYRPTPHHPKSPYAIRHAGSPSCPPVDGG